MFRYIKKNELFQFGGRHFISEDHIRLHTMSYGAQIKGSNWISNPYELLIIVLKGKGLLSTVEKNYEFNQGDQFYLTNVNYKIDAYTELEIELIELPGLYGAALFSLEKSKIVFFKSKEISLSPEQVLVNEVYGKVYVHKLKNEVYQSSLKSREELLILCLEGSCHFKINEGQFSVKKGEQVYLKNEMFEITVGDGTVLEFVQAPSETYMNMLILQK